MKFNSINCIEKGCFSRSVPCIKFAIGSKLKNVIGSEKPTTVDPEIDIQPVNAEHFFCMVQKKGHKSFLWISYISSSNCNCCKTNNSSTQKWYANTTSCIFFENSKIFMKEKPSYTQEKLLKKVPKEYHSEIKVFIKQDINILPNHRPKNHKIELFKGKQVPFMRNSKFLSEQKIEAIVTYSLGL